MSFLQPGYISARAYLTILIAFSAAFATSVKAAWEIQPLIEARTTYTDNIEFEEDEDSEFVLELSPGINILKDEGRLQVDIDYLLQNFYFLDDSDLNSDHQLDAFATYETIQDRFFIDAYTTIEQVLTSTDQVVSVDNINDTGNTTDELSAGIEPRWIQPLGSRAVAEVSYLYEINRFEDETDEDGIAGDIDDNDRQRFLTTLGNQDPEADKFDWELGYQYEEVDFEDGDEILFRRSQLGLGYAVLPRLDIVGRYGYESNDFDTDGTDSSLDDQDDDFWDLGFIAGLGSFTTLEVRRGERFFGNTWFGLLEVEGNKLRLTAQYEEEVELETFDTNNRETFIGPVVIDNDIDLDVLGDNDSVFETQRWELTAQYTVGKSTFAATFLNDDREFVDSADEEQFEAYSLGWIWQVTGRSAITTIFQWEESENTNDG